MEFFSQEFNANAKINNITDTVIMEGKIFFLFINITDFLVGAILLLAYFHILLIWISTVFSPLKLDILPDNHILLHIKCD